MKIALFGAAGMIGSRIAQEAERRGHQVSKLSRASGVDARDAGSVARSAKAHDAIVSAIGPHGPDDKAQDLVVAAHGLIEGARKAGVRRLVVVGGAGSLEVAPGKRLVDTPQFPEAWKPVALAAADVLQIYRKVDDLDWTYFSPAAFIQPGERTGKFRTGGDQLLTDAKGESRISAEDFAAAIVDELETPRQVRKRLTVAY